MSRANRSREWHVLFRMSEPLADPILVVLLGWLKNAASEVLPPNQTQTRHRA